MFEAKSPIGKRGPTPTPTKNPTARLLGGFSAKEKTLSVITKKIVFLKIDFIQLKITKLFLLNELLKNHFYSGIKIYSSVIPIITQFKQLLNQRFFFFFGIRNHKQILLCHSEQSEGSLVFIHSF
ncbi:Hypothetical protein IALB_2240 [Ignavibacterium album JCM 16511]|uniref:Uncharacterized protein n=1 Tax=Ignavibacterium album (strain DSM 19864 / JCM 16511 / NBRC 101810 / Mat9-16) TaxID=945713 RepID=I0ALT6_IGNAJ|nr:Hypothetical protein IALB_2240 [Ignavibacterium album JCM 16511]